MNKLAKVVISPDGVEWKIEVIDETGETFHIRYEEFLNDAMDYGYRQGTLYQLEVDIRH